MCTIMSVSRQLFNADIVDRIYDDAKKNSDGWCLILAEREEITQIVHSMNVETIITLLQVEAWDRMFLHARYATRGDVNVLNTHGFRSGKFLYMHNGCLYDRAADQHAVDSQLIGDWLKVDVKYCMERLQSEPFANVFVIDTTEGVFHVSRSSTGTLYTDWDGNYSTNRVGEIKHEVPQFSEYCHFYDGWEMESEAAYDWRKYLDKEDDDELNEVSYITPPVKKLG